MIRWRFRRTENSSGGIGVSIASELGEPCRKFSGLGMRIGACSGTCAFVIKVKMLGNERNHPSTSYHFSGSDVAIRAVWCIAAGALLLVLGEVTPLMAKTPLPKVPEKTDTASAITLISHGVTVALGDKADLDAFVTTSNDKARIKALADALNPGIVDGDKLRAFVAVLGGQPELVRKALAGHILNVGASGLGVLSVEPTRVEAFGAGYRLTIERIVGQRVLARSNVSFDAGLAKQRNAAAEEAVTAANLAVRAVEGGKADSDGLSVGDLRWRRAQAASAWRIAANAWVSAEPADRAAKKAAAAAQKARNLYDMPSGGLIGESPPPKSGAQPGKANP